MLALSAGRSFYKPFAIPESPSPPGFDSQALDEARGPAPSDKAKTADKAKAGETPAASAVTTASIGLSPVIQSFLLHLQELGFNSIPGTDGDDKLTGWSNSLIDSGNGDDVIDAWSGSVVDAGAGADVIHAWSETKVHGGSGNDRIDIWSGSQADGGDGDDVIRAWSETVVNGGAGNDVLSAWSDSKVDGGDGDDRIAVWANSIANGGAGNDTIYAIEGGSVSGGTGDDIVSVGANSTVSFAPGDGKDTIYADKDTVVKLGAGFAPDKTRVSVSGYTATITFEGSEDAITLELGPRGGASLAFADGTSLAIEPEQIIGAALPVHVTKL